MATSKWRRPMWAFIWGVPAGVVIGFTLNTLPDWGVFVGIVMAAGFSYAFAEVWPSGRRDPRWSPIPRRCPEHGKRCSGASCCCADKHRWGLA